MNTRSITHKIAIPIFHEFLLSQRMSAASISNDHPSRKVIIHLLIQFLNPHPSNLPPTPPQPTPPRVPPFPHSPSLPSPPTAQYTPHHPANSDRSQSHCVYPHSPGIDQSPTQAPNDCPIGIESTPAVYLPASNSHSQSPPSGLASTASSPHARKKAHPGFQSTSADILSPAHNAGEYPST